jgi:hypothetical protein
LSKKLQSAAAASKLKQVHATEIPVLFGLQDIICTAIREKRHLTFVYEMKQRTIEPHVLAYQKAGDELVLGGWQLAGGSGMGWRDFHATKLTLPNIAEIHFAGPRAIYRRDDPKLGRVVCQL